MKIIIDTKEVQLVAKKLRLYPIRIGRQMHKLINRISLRIERGAKIAVTTGPTRAFDTGNLFKTIHARSISPFIGEVRAEAPYSLYVHEGTRYMRARQFFDAAINNNSDIIEKDIRNFIKNILK